MLSWIVFVDSNLNSKTLLSFKFGKFGISIKINWRNRMPALLINEQVQTGEKKIQKLVFLSVFHISLWLVSTVKCVL